jgi:hypothetical protein
MANSVSQLSLIGREEELQIKDGEPPIEVAEAMEADGCWRKGQEMSRKWRRSRRNGAPCLPSLGRRGISGQSEAALSEPGAEPLLEDENGDFSEEDETGPRLDARS